MVIGARGGSESAPGRLATELSQAHSQFRRGILTLSERDARCADAALRALERGESVREVRRRLGELGEQEGLAVELGNALLGTRSPAAHPAAARHPDLVVVRTARSFCEDQVTYLIGRPAQGGRRALMEAVKAWARVGGDPDVTVRDVVALFGDAEAGVVERDVLSAVGLLPLGGVVEEIVVSDHTSDLPADCADAACE